MTNKTKTTNIILGITIVMIAICSVLWWTFRPVGDDSGEIVIYPSLTPELTIIPIPTTTPRATPTIGFTPVTPEHKPTSTPRPTITVMPPPYPTVEPTPILVPEPTQEPKDSVYKVESGDTLWAISWHFCHTSLLWGEICQHNDIEKCHLIYPNQYLLIDGKCYGDVTKMSPN